MTRATIALLLMLGLLLAACAPAEQETGPVTIDREELEAFADRFFPAQMKTLHATAWWKHAPVETQAMPVWNL